MFIAWFLCVAVWFVAITCMAYIAWFLCAAVWFVAITCMVHLWPDNGLPNGSGLGIIILSFLLGSFVFGLVVLVAVP